MGHIIGAIFQSSQKRLLLGVDNYFVCVQA
jgi:hypothetical protein